MGIASTMSVGVLIIRAPLTEPGSMRHKEHQWNLIFPAHPIRDARCRFFPYLNPLNSSNRAKPVNITADSRLIPWRSVRHSLAPPQWNTRQ